MVIVCTRNGSNGRSSGFTGRKAENGTLTCHLHKTEAVKRRNWNLDLYSTKRKVSEMLTLQNPTLVLILAKYNLL
jgi:hypothetical protein